MPIIKEMYNNLVFEISEKSLKVIFFKLAKNSKSSSEFAGPVFSPDGSTLFVNIQHDGLTLAITGPWEKNQFNF